MDRRRRHHKNSIPKKRRIAEHRSLLKEKRLRHQELLRAKEQEEGAKAVVPEPPQVKGNVKLKLLDTLDEQSGAQEAEIKKSAISELLETFGGYNEEDDTESSEDEEQGDDNVNLEETSDKEKETFESDNEEEDIEITVNEDDENDWYSRHFDPMLSAKYVDTLQGAEIAKSEFKTSKLGNVLLKRKNVELLPEEEKSDSFNFFKDLKKAKIREKVLKNFEQLNKSSTSELQLQLLNILLRYKDLFYPSRTFDDEEEIRSAYCLHILNHLLKTRNRIVSNNAKQKQLESAEEYRDQGLTRPKVLVLLPFRDSVLRVVNCLLSLLFGTSEKANVLNLKRFQEEFRPESEKTFLGKPDDYAQTFRGNCDDAFRIGLAVTKKSLRLYTDFYQSDIIICSPLSLRMIIGAKGDKDRDFDFLSSIEIVVLDQAEMFLMQNWEHIIHIFNHLNLQPKDSHNTDFSRVKMWVLEGYSKFYRQLLMFSSISSNELVALFSKQSTNYAGQIMLRNVIDANQAAVKQIYISCPQTFRAFECDSVSKIADARFKFFTENVLPSIRDQLSHCLVFVSSYFDFVRLRNYFREQEVDFTHICEYTKEGKVAQARSLFFHTSRKFLLMTERFHFYNRYKIKGIRHIVFYQLPLNPQLYSDLCNLMHASYQGKKFVGDESSFSSTALYCKFDVQLLSNVLGTERAAHLVKNAPKQDTFTFVTEHE